MKLLDRYIMRNIFYATFVVGLIIIGLLFLLSLLAELKNIGQGDYGMMEMLLYVCLRLPNQIYQFSPMIILVGSIVGLSSLLSHHELTVMRTAGLSVLNIILTVIGAAFIMILCMSIMGEWLAPHLSYKAEVSKENARNAGQAVVTSGGVWFHVDNNFIHVENVVGRQLLENLTRYEVDDHHQLQAAYFAKSLSLVHDEWQMNDGVKTTFYPDHTQSETFVSAPWNLKFNPNLLNVGLVEANEMSLPKLAKFALYLQKNGLQASEYQFNFWQRMMQPLQSLVMVSLAIPFVLGAFKSQTTGWRIVIGVLFGFGFFIFNSFLGQLCIVYQLPASVAAIFPTVIFLLLSLILSKQLIRY